VTTEGETNVTVGSMSFMRRGVFEEELDAAAP
jgi:hypothetical protein